jgi:hypothetical protein
MIPGDGLNKAIAIGLALLFALPPSSTLSATEIHEPIASNMNPAAAVAAAAAILSNASSIKEFIDAEEQKRTQQEILDKLTKFTHS